MANPPLLPISLLFVAALVVRSLSFNPHHIHSSTLCRYKNENRHVAVNGHGKVRRIFGSFSSLSGTSTTKTKHQSSKFDDFEQDSIVKSASLSPDLNKLEKNARTKIISESIAPWRTFRLFLCGSLGAGATLGGLITLARVAAGMSGAQSDVDMNADFINLAIDFGAAGFFAFIAKFDLDKGAQLEEEVGVNLEKKAERKEIYKAMQKREQLLSSLNLGIRVSSDGQTTQASVKAIQEGAKQHLIIVIGPKQVVKDALLGASLLKMNNFAMTNVLVLPYEYGTDINTQQTRPSGGFGEKPIWEARPYVAEAVGEGWEEYITAEMVDAEKQSGAEVKDKGIAIIVGNNGKVVRRGVGRIPWRQTLEQLNELKATKENDDFVSLL